MSLAAIFTSFKPSCLIMEHTERIMRQKAIKVIVAINAEIEKLFTFEQGLAVTIGKD